MKKIEKEHMLENKTFKNFLLAFKIFYLLYLLFTFNAYTNGNYIIDAATYVVTLWGMILVGWMLVQYKLYWKVKNLCVLLAFVMSYVISAVVNYQYGITDNVKAVIWMLFPIILLYVSVGNYKIWEMKREILILSNCYVIYCTICNAVSLSMMYGGRNLEFTDAKGTIHAIGFRWGRLWGMYDDPNHGATISVLAVIFAVYLILATKKVWLRIVWILAAVVNYSYILFSDSRTGIICIAAVMFIGIGLAVYGKLALFGAGKRMLSAILIAALSAVLLMGVSNGIKVGYNKMDQAIAREIYKKNILNSDAPKQSDAVIGRKNDISQDSSNGRLEIWESGLQIAKESPIVGVSYRNMTAYAKENAPESYMMKNPSGVQYDSMHNLEMDILVSQGAIGVILFVWFVAGTLIFIMKNVKRVPKGCKVFAGAAFTAAAAIALASTFISIIFYVNTPQGYCFWLCLGYLVAMLQKSVSNTSMEKL